ncbi:hypothetical protein OE88DRAFT_1605039, partial [Heliocybe sulcata]
DLWFPDGSIVLEAAGNVFRVHKSLLLMHSEVFKAMLDFPPGSAQESFEGAPLVHLDEDVDSDDIRCLLNAIYKRQYFIKGAYTPFDRLAALLRMSKRYRIKHLKDEIAAHLSLIYPTTLSDFRRRDKTLLGDSTTHMFEALAMANEVPLDAILPAAYYCAAELPIEDIVYGITVGMGDETSEFELKSEHDKGIILVGREDLIQYKHELMDSFLLSVSPTPTCRAKHLCRAALASYLSDQKDRGLLSCCDIFTRQPLWKQYRNHTNQLCQPCKDVFQASETKALETVWKRLPVIFGLKE